MAHSTARDSGGATGTGTHTGTGAGAGAGAGARAAPCSERYSGQCNTRKMDPEGTQVSLRFARSTAVTKVLRTEIGSHDRFSFKVITAIKL